MSAIEIKHLKLIKTIAKTENLTTAAQKLFITQPALSRQLIDIEKRLGVSLFLRTKKRMILTKEGNSLLQTANSVLEELERAELEISKIVKGETGRLRIGVECMFCFEWLPRVMEAFQVRYPKIDLSIGRTQILQEDLNTSASDLVITALPLESADMDCHPLFEDEVAVVMSPDHPLRAKPYLRPKDFSHIKMISQMAKSQDPFYQFVLVKEGIELKAFMWVEQVEAIVELVRAGLGVSFLPKWSVRSLLDSGKLHAKSFTQKGIWATWKAVHLKNDNLPAYQIEFIRLLTDRPWVKAA